MTSLFSILEIISEMGQETAHALGKEVRIHFPEVDSQIPQHWTLPLTLAFTHIIRNSIDHGIVGHSGNIWIKTPPKHAAHQFVLEVQDDGRGIDPERIKNKAIAAGLLPEGAKPSQQAILALLFYPGFSTQDSPGVYSGRGIGMDVIHHEVVKLGGHMTLIQNENQGLLVRMEIPVPTNI